MSVVCLFGSHINTGTGSLGRASRLATKQILVGLRQRIFFIITTRTKLNTHLPTLTYNDLQLHTFFTGFFF